MTMSGRANGMAVLVGILLSSACSPRETVVDGFGDHAKLRVVNREITRIPERDGVRLSRALGNGVAWVEGTDFRAGTIELDIRGREDMQQLYVGVAFHRKDNDTYEAVYLRPFNFRATDSVRKQHAIQYIKLPDFDWPRLRQQFPEEFENPVDTSLVPTDWVRLRVVVQGATVRSYAGSGVGIALEARKLGELNSGQIGLWVGNDSGGDFADLTITPTQ
jgi:hypothetical protein